MSKTIWTIGYGNDAPEVFLERLKSAGVASVIDVRRKGSKSWCYAYNQGHVIFGTLGDAGIYVSDGYHLGNEFDTLDAYKEWLSSWIGRLNIPAMKSPICLLCAENPAFEKDGTPRCHRVYVADALVKILGEDWTVEHI